MAKRAEEIDRTQDVEAARRELAAMPSGTLTWDEIRTYIRRLGIKTPGGWSSTESIRELRGPLPDDDPDFANVDRR